jgi:hypothetical protein
MKDAEGTFHSDLRHHARIYLEDVKKTTKYLNQ